MRPERIKLTGKPTECLSLDLSPLEPRQSQSTSPNRNCLSRLSLSLIQVRLLKLGNCYDYFFLFFGGVKIKFIILYGIEIVPSGVELPVSIA